MKPLRAAIYARFSTDKQRAKSIDDQIARCERRAAESGWTVVARYSDEALSGATLPDRVVRDRPLAGA